MINEDVIWLEVNLKTSFFQPEKLEKGLWFLNSLYPGTDKEYVEIWELEVDVPEEDYDEFVLVNGFPVQVVLTMEMANPDESDDIVAYFEDLGWFYNVETEEMDMIDLKEINTIIQEYGGKVFLLVDEWFYNNDDEVIPETENNLVIVTYPFEEEEEFIED
jgi:hypothetical protein